MKKKFVIIGKRGRITIPEEIRNVVGIKYNDLLSFEVQPNNTIIIRKERYCDNCVSENSMPLSEVLKRYPEEERDKAFIALSADWSSRQGGGLSG